MREMMVDISMTMEHLMLARAVRSIERAVPPKFAGNDRERQLPVSCLQQ